MKNIRVIVAGSFFCLMMALMLTSCVGTMPGLGLSTGGGYEAPTGFYENLADEYNNLSSYEAEYMHHQDDAVYFADKAQLASQGKNVEPDRPKDRNIPGFAMQELSAARSMLMDALNFMNMDNNGALLAMAQTRYDCWLVHQEDFPDEDFWSLCKTGFYDALALLNISEEDRTAQNVYFDSGSIAVDEEARKTLEELAAHYSERSEWEVTLKGYTDRKGDRRQNKVLSMRRAIAVKNMLGQYGFDLDKIAISAEGESVDVENPENERNGRRVEIRVRPHYVARNKKGFHSLSGWDHSGEF